MNTIIEPTITRTDIEHRVIESCIPAASLQDICNKYEISNQFLVVLLNNYFSASELSNIEEYICRQIDVDMDVIEESIDLSPDAMLDKMNPRELKGMVKDAGMDLSGKESKEELTGMVKVLAKKESKELEVEGGFDAEYIGGYRADVYIKLAEKVDVDELADEIKKSLSTGGPLLDKAEVKNVSISQLPKNLFENKKLSKFIRK